MIEIRNQQKKNKSALDIEKDLTNTPDFSLS